MSEYVTYFKRSNEEGLYPISLTAVVEDWTVQSLELKLGSVRDGSILTSTRRLIFDEPKAFGQTIGTAEGYTVNYWPSENPFEGLLGCSEYEQMFTEYPEISEPLDTAIKEIKKHYS